MQSDFLLSVDNVRQALARVAGPVAGVNVVEAGMISGLVVRGGEVGFVLALPAALLPMRRQYESACEQAVRTLPGVIRVTLAVTNAEENTTLPRETAPARRAVWNRTRLPHVWRIVAVASGKGGVGKSTTAVNLAVALAGMGLRAGLLDADIQGPSVPRMLGLSEKPVMQDGLLQPATAHGVRAMSMGLMVAEASAMVWRGPQLVKALDQMLRGTGWGTEAAPLDLLFIDLPPGTGDVHLSLAQHAPVDGAILVTTPQEVAVADARKALDMFRKTGIPVLGVVENMSGFTDPAGMHHALFGAGGGERLASEAQAPLLARIPLDMQLGLASDSGRRYADTNGYYTDILNQLPKDFFERH